jgi:hypothetical protein
MRGLAIFCFVSLSLVSPAKADCDWGRALDAITWVLDRDPGAQGCFTLAYACQPVGNGQHSGMCMNGYNAVLYCQRHNDEAQKIVAECAQPAIEYLKGRNRF